MSHPEPLNLPLAPAKLLRDAHGTPWSGQYHDVYHARQGALEQAQHVFLRGNQLPQRWRVGSALGRGAFAHGSFTVCEAGFGLGRNFLALWHAWRNDPQRCPRLHVLAFEAHPFHREDLAQANRDLPESLQPLARQLAQEWPLLLPGLHRLEFDSGALTLTLAFGPIAHMSRQVQAGVDAFFLDGFAPRVNPQMWTRELFGQLVRIANAGATLATWCVAGQVRRDLSDAGFLVSLAPGFGGKREMLVATLRSGLGRENRPGLAQGGRVLVVGAGIAGASIAHALALRGSKVTVVDPVLAYGLGAAHAGHRAVAVTPVLSVDDNHRTRLVRAGVLRALHRWQVLPEWARPKRCGAFVMPKEPQQQARWQAALAHMQFPHAWVCWQTAEQITARLGEQMDGQKSGWQSQRAGLWLEQAQSVQPEALLQALLTHPNIQTLPQHVLRLALDARQNWRAVGENGVLSDALSDTWQMAVLANAYGAWPLLATSMGDERVLNAYPKLAAGRRTGGQVSHYIDHPQLLRANAILSADGYWLPAVNGSHTAGSTYWHDVQSVHTTVHGHIAIRKKLKNFLDVDEHHPAWQPAGGWAGWRAGVAGRLPAIGAVVGSAADADTGLGLDSTRLWLACAFGSRGFTWAALAGDIIAATLHSEPQVLERDILTAIAPR